MTNFKDSATIIEIKKREVAIPDSARMMYREAILDELHGVTKPISDDDVVTPTANVKTKSFVPVKIWVPDEGEREYYVELDDRGLFDDLIRVSDHTLDTLKDESYGVGKKVGFQFGRSTREEEIKHLSLYRRLIFALFKKL